MYNRIFGGLLLLFSIGGIFSLIQTISNPAWPVGKKAFIASFQLLLIIIPLYFGIKAIQKKLCSEKTALSWCLILIVINSISYFVMKDQFVGQFRSNKMTSRQQEQETQWPEIIRATADGDLVQMKKLISAGVDLNVLDSTGYPALLYAHSFESLRLLLEGGADVNFVTKYNVTMLNLRPPLTYHSSYKATKFMLDNGLDEKIITIKNYLGSTPLHYGDRCSFCDDDFYQDGTKNIELLIKYGAPLNSKNTDGESPIFTVQDESKEILIKNGADVFVMNKKEENLLFKVNDYDLFKRLVELGLDIKKINNKGETILHHTASEKIVELIDDAIDVDHRDEYGRSALFWCFSNPKKLKALLKSKADVNITDKRGNIALHQYVRAYGVKNSESEEVIKLLLSTDIKVNHKNNDGKTALDLARFDKVKKLLLEKGAKSSS